MTLSGIQSLNTKSTSLIYCVRRAFIDLPLSQMIKPYIVENRWWINARIGNLVFEPMRHTNYSKKIYMLHVRTEPLFSWCTIEDYRSTSSGIYLADKWNAMLYKFKIIVATAVYRCSKVMRWLMDRTTKEKQRNDINMIDWLLVV